MTLGNHQPQPTVCGAVGSSEYWDQEHATEIIVDAEGAQGSVKGFLRHSQPGRVRLEGTGWDKRQVLQRGWALIWGFKAMDGLIQGEGRGLFPLRST